MSSADLSRHQILQKRVDPIVLSHTPCHRGKRRIGRPFGITQSVAKRRPLLVRRHGDRDPAVVTSEVIGTGGLIEVLRGRSRAHGSRPEPAVLRRRSIRSLAQPRRSRRPRPWPLRRGRLARPLPVLEGKQQAEQGVESGVRIADAVGLERHKIGMPCEPRESSGVLDHECERGLIAPRPVEPEPRHSEHDDVRPIGPQRLEAETELLQDPRRVVLDQDVTGRDEPVHERDATIVTEVHGHALLVGVQRGEDRPALPELVLGLGTPPTSRAPSGRLGDSRWITSAPRSVSTWPANGPAQIGRHVEHAQTLNGSPA